MGILKIPVLLIDNRDSFTFNLVQLLEQNDAEVNVESNSDLALKKAANYRYIVFSPGPGLPSDFPVMHQILDRYKEGQKILGVCLGHQAIATYFGGVLINHTIVSHGITKAVKVNKISGNSCLNGLPDKLEVGLYHSWFVSELNIPEVLQVSCSSSDNIIMGIMHKEKDIEGLQFHPESILTNMGSKIIANWLK